MSTGCHRPSVVVLVDIMDSGSAPVVLHQVPLLPQPEAKAAIITALPNVPLTADHILLIRKEAKYQAFVTLPV